MHIETESRLHGATYITWKTQHKASEKISGTCSKMGEPLRSMPVARSCRMHQAVKQAPESTELAGRPVHGRRQKHALSVPRGVSLARNVAIEKGAEAADEQNFRMNKRATLIRRTGTRSTCSRESLRAARSRRRWRNRRAVDCR
jgi:hypothetical protein